MTNKVFKIEPTGPNRNKSEIIITKDDLQNLVNTRGLKHLGLPIKIGFLFKEYNFWKYNKIVINPWHLSTNTKLSIIIITGKAKMEELAVYSTTHSMYK